MAENHLTAVALLAVSRRYGITKRAERDIWAVALNGNAVSLSVLAAMSKIIVTCLVGLRRSLVSALSQLKVGL